ncbi:MAG: glycosyltransferase family 39 protein [Acidimicrobiales bacterium]
MRSKLGAGRASFDVVTAAALALTVAKLIGAALNPLHFRPLTPHDDALYVRRAVQMMHGHWVGVLDQYTLMRGPLYPLYLAFVGRSGLPLSIIEQLLICAASFSVAREIARFLGGDRKTTAGVYLLVLLFPFQETWSGSHLIRDNLMHVALLVVIALGFAAWREPRLRSLLWFCLALGAMSILREDALWLAPAAVAVIYLHSRRVFTNGGLLRVVPVLIVAFLAMIGPQLGVIALNAHYGLPARTLFDDKHFGRAHQALARYVNDGSSSPFTFTAELQEHVAQSSPAYARVAPAMAHWRDTAGVLEVDYFRFGLADALFAAGVIGERRDRNALLDAIADELGELCEDEARPACHAFTGPVPMGVVRARDVLHAAARPFADPAMLFTVDVVRDTSAAEAGPVAIVDDFENVSNQNPRGASLSADGEQVLYSSSRGVAWWWDRVLLAIAAVAMPVLRIAGLVAGVVLVRRRCTAPVVAGLVLLVAAYLRAAQVALATRFSMAYYGQFYLQSSALLLHVATILWLVAALRMWRTERDALPDYAANCTRKGPMRERLRFASPR